MANKQTQRPTARDAALAVRAGLGARTREIERLAVGSQHYVYGVTTEDGRRVVVRMAIAEAADALAGGVYWHARVRGVGAPLARLLHAELSPASGFPYMLLERLPGQDLALVYDQLTHVQLHTLAAQIVALQRAVAMLPSATGYGFARSYDDPRLRANWLDVVLVDIERSHQRIIAARSLIGAAPQRHVARVRTATLAIADELRAIAPIAFLDDTTTKNVLIYDGRLSGVVDTDYVCFGDPLFTLALTRVALLAHDHAPEYADYWQALLALSPAQERAVALYVAVFLLGFISEIGQRFNQQEPTPLDHAYLSRLERLLDEALATA